MRDVQTKNAGDLYTTDDFNEGVNGELKNIVIDSGAGFNNTNLKQLLESTVRLNASRASYIEDASSTGANYVLTIADVGKQGLIALDVGATISFVVTNMSTITNPSITFINPALGTYTIKRLDGTPLVLNEIKAGFIVDLYFDGTDFLIKNLNEVTSLQDIEEEQLYTVTGVSGDEYTLSRSVGLNPPAYYNGMVVKFIATHTNTNAVTLKISGLGAIALNDSLGYVLREGDVTSGDLIVAMYSTAGNNFKVIKRTDTIVKSGQGIPAIRLDNNDYVGFANTPTAAGGSPLTIDNIDDKSSIYLLDSTTSYTVNLPDSTMLPRVAFSVFIVHQTSVDVTLNFVLTGADTMTINGSNSATSVTLPAFGGAIVKLEVLAPNLWKITSIQKASQTQTGIARFATQAEVNTGTATDLIVSPETMKNAPFLGNLDVVYPVTSKFVADSPLMVTNPDQIVPGWGAFIWAPVGTVGERFTHMLASPASIQTVGALGVNDAITGSTNGHSLTISETSQHSHYIAVDTDAAIGDNPTFVTNTNSAAIKNSSSDSPPLSPYFLAAQGGSAAAPNIGLSSLAIGAGGSPHIHVLNVKCYVDYAYRRTA